MNRALTVIACVLLLPSSVAARPDRPAPDAGALVTGLAAGASSAESATMSDKRLAVSVLREHQHVLVVTKSTPPTFEGSFVGSHHDSILVRLDQGTVAVPLDYVDELWVRGRTVRGSAFIGAVAGMAAAAFVGIFALVTNSESFTNGNDYIVTVGAYALAGAAIGAVAGSFPRWQQRFP